MPFITTLAGFTGYGRVPFIPAPGPVVSTPGYYFQNTGWLMNQPGHTAVTLQLKAISSIALQSGIVRTYSNFTAAWTYIHDKDLDSNIWYGMPEGTRVLSRYTLENGGTVVRASTLTTYTGATTSVLGACYAPSLMWTGTAYGAFIIGGFNQAVIHVLEFGPQKTITNTYTVPYTSEVYGTEVVPKAASGFNCNYGVAYTRGSKQMSSWTVDMDARSWTNRIDNSYTGSVNGPANGDGMIYYAPGKWITANDAAATTNRIAMNDTSSARLYVWTITEGTNRLNWTYLSTITTGGNGYYPYHISSNAYNALNTVFSPSAISNLQFWLDANDSTTFTLSGPSNITAWRDKSSNALTATATNSPFLSTSRVYFNGTNTYFTVPHNANLQLTANFGVFAVFTGTDATTSRMLISKFIDGSPYTGWNFRSVGLGTSNAVWFNSAADTTVTNVSISDNTPKLVDLLQTGTAFTSYINGTSNLGVTIALPAAANVSMTIGTRSVNNPSQLVFSGNIAEILIYNATVATADRQKIEGYLAWKWQLQGNLPSDHPFKNAAPTV